MLTAVPFFTTVAYRVANDVIYTFNFTKIGLSTLLRSITLSTFIFTLIVVIISYLIAISMEYLRQ